MTILEGLHIIDKYKLPHPEWEFINSSRDLKRFNKIKDYVGWTIRTVAVKNGPWKNLYINWLPKSKVPDKIDEFQKKLKGRAIFVVYPSWKWKKGGTILLQKNREVIEVVKGEIVNLMRQGKLDARYIYNNNKLVEVVGRKDFLSITDRKKILLARKLKKGNVILEWGITTRNKFIFYRIEDLSEAARLLLKKYS